MTKKAIVLLADGFEDIEAVTPVDYLRRAGIEVTTVSIYEKNTVTSRWGEIKLVADTTLPEIAGQSSNFDAVIIPGGMPGAANLAASKETSELLKELSAADKLICAICASPVVVLAPLGLITGKRFTCYPGLEEKITDAHWSEDRVVIDGNLITSRAAGTAGHFAIDIIKKLLDEDTGNKTAESVMLSA